MVTDGPVSEAACSAPPRHPAMFLPPSSCGASGGLATWARGHAAPTCSHLHARPGQGCWDCLVVPQPELLTGIAERGLVGGRAVRFPSEAAVGLRKLSGFLAAPPPGARGGAEALPGGGSRVACFGPAESASVTHPSPPLSAAQLVSSSVWTAGSVPAPRRPPAVSPTWREVGACLTAEPAL